MGSTDSKLGSENGLNWLGSRLRRYFIENKSKKENRSSFSISGPQLSDDNNSEVACISREKNSLRKRSKAEINRCHIFRNSGNDDNDSEVAFVSRENNSLSEKSQSEINGCDVFQKSEKDNMIYERSEGDGVAGRNDTEVSEERKPVAEQRDESKFGDCYIFDHQEFKSDAEPRPGSGNDVKRLRKDFDGLNFNVFSNYLNSTEQQTLEVLEDAAKKDYEDRDCLVCCFLTHGKEGQLLMHDNKYLEVDNILECFSRSACESLAGKPKIFIFQACRGKNLEEGRKKYEKTDVASNTENPVSTPNFPDNLDFLLVYSTYEGNVAFRDQQGNHGSFFIDELCRTLEDFSEKLDLLEILTIVNYRVALLFQCKNKDIKHKKQMPGFFSTLTSKVKFDKKIQPYTSDSTKHFAKRRMESPLGTKSEGNPLGDMQQYNIQKPKRIRFLFFVNKTDSRDSRWLDVVFSLGPIISKRGYQNELRQNWSEEDLMHYLQEARFFSNTDCCICFITCKAEGDYLYDVKGKRFLKKDVVTMFAGNKCRNLLEKPKIVIFLMSSSTGQTNNTWDGCVYPDGTDGDSTANENTVPIHADILEVAISIHESTHLEAVMYEFCNIFGSDSTDHVLSQLTDMFKHLVQYGRFYSPSNEGTATFSLNSTLTQLLFLHESNERS